MKTMIVLMLAMLAVPMAYADQNNLVAPSCVVEGKVVCLLETSKRTQLPNGLAHYEWTLKVGPGQFDRIGLHRIVKEWRPYSPLGTTQATMLVHGDAYGFGAFIASLQSQVVPHDQSIAVQMAISGIDVWGIDLRWTRVPANTTNLNFMANWGVDVDLKDLDIAVNFTRNFRRYEGSIDRQLNLLGWSRGGQLGYLYLAKETQKQPLKRNIKSFIPVDILLKTDNDTIRQSACTYSDLLRSQIANGQYYDDSGLATQNIAALAQFLPDEDSPIMPGLTNRQVALLFLSSTYLLVPPGTAGTPWYHFNGGKFDDTGLPADLAFTSLDYMYEYAAGAAPYEPIRMILEINDVTCGTSTRALDRYLGNIRVPILYVYGAGGFGKAGLYTTRLTASRDISSIGVQLYPDEL
ncbi:MAG TPA: hypothetical protein VHL14_15310, partial [Steroidobacteraceae bacterium]|nr:hypothetical protein [Steroidobacteraceae bacterium]